MEKPFGGMASGRFFASIRSGLPPIPGNGLMPVKKMRHYSQYWLFTFPPGRSGHRLLWLVFFFILSMMENDETKELNREE